MVENKDCPEYSVCTFRLTFNRCLLHCYHRPKTKTNADMMKAMSNEDLAELLADNWCDLVCGSNAACDNKCKQHILDWLNREVAGDGNL